MFRQLRKNNMAIMMEIMMAMMMMMTMAMMMMKVFSDRRSVGTVTEEAKHCRFTSQQAAPMCL